MLGTTNLIIVVAMLHSLHTDVKLEDYHANLFLLNAKIIIGLL